MWVIQMSQVVLDEPFKCIMKDLSSGNKIFKGKSQHSTGKISCWFQEVNHKLCFKNNRKQLQAQILTNSKYFIKNNSITPSVEKGNLIDYRKSNVTWSKHNYSSQANLPTRLTKTVSHQWSKFSLLLLVTFPHFCIKKSDPLKTQVTETLVFNPLEENLCSESASPRTKSRIGVFKQK